MRNSFEKGVAIAASVTFYGTPPRIEGQDEQAQMQIAEGTEGTVVGPTEKPDVLVVNFEGHDLRVHSGWLKAA